MKKVTLASLSTITGALCALLSAPAMADEVKLPPTVCMDVSHGDTADGTIVQIWDCSGVPAQRWTFVK